jgi:hypothetical protein
MLQNYILGGDFNCFLSRNDCMGEPQVSKGFESFLRGFGAKDSWTNTGQNSIFTHYTGRGATRIDRIYLSTSLWPNKKSAEILAAAFTDNNAAVVRLKMQAPNIQWGKERWRLNITLLQEETRHIFKWQWEEWKQKIPNYQNILEFWDNYAKGRIQRFFRAEGLKTARDRRNAEQFYYTCMYDLLRAIPGEPHLTTRLKNFKAKIVALQNTTAVRILIDAREPEPFPNKRATVYHLFRARRRQQGRLITRITDVAGTTHDTRGAIMNTLFSAISGGYQELPVDSDFVEAICVRTQDKLTSQQQAQLESPINEIELRRAVMQGAGRKSPGTDGIPAEFYSWEWSVIKMELIAVYNVMFHDEYITKGQARTIIVCVPKTPAPKRITDYRPITLLNA